VRRLRFLLAAVGAVVALGLLSSIVSQGFQEVARAEAERAELEQRRARLEQSIHELEATLLALRGDPQAVESMARQELGWVRPGELVVVIASPTPQPAPTLTEPEPTPILRLRE
jgi:cell division protein FtsB